MNEERRKLWLEAIGRPDFLPSASSVVCSRHFKEEEFERKATLVCLSKNAVPRLLEADSENLPVPKVSL